MRYHDSGNKQALALLHNLNMINGQSRALLLLGKVGWGKFSAGLDFAQNILQSDPLDSSDFFCFRNDHFTLKTNFFLLTNPHPELTMIWLKLLLRRLNISSLINETLSLPTGVKLSTLKDELYDCILQNTIPSEKSIQKLLSLTAVLDKKTGIPISIIRELSKFHTTATHHGRVSILGNFDTADDTTQNAALKLLEEPFPNHWLIITAEDENAIIPTILSRTLKINFQKPLASDLHCLDKNTHFQSSLDLMEEQVHHLSQLKYELIAEFFNHCTTTIEFGINFLQFSEKLQKNHHSILFLEELLLCFQDSLRLRQMILRPNISIPLLNPQYQEFSQKFMTLTTRDLEDFVHQIEKIKYSIARPVIKDDLILPPLLLDISRTLRQLR